MAGVRVILASRSAARRKMLEEAGVKFESVSADLDEEALTKKMLAAGTEIDGIAPGLARAKALYVAERNPGALVIGADQTLDIEGKMMTKAASVEDAKNKLKALRGKAHRLISAVCVVHDDKILWEEARSANLTMHDFDDVFLDSYAANASEALTRSVGAYEIEGEGRKLFSAVAGDMDTIMGMPLAGLMGFLKQEGAL
ncbi:MAG TPA: hypothetical protein DEA55_06215 [Rhodospirillaceae bacterium]|nr:hypothetical protein [Rhodospirillaceae bacterium]